MPGDDVHDVHVGPKEVSIFGAQKRPGGGVRALKEKEVNVG